MNTWHSVTSRFEQTLVHVLQHSDVDILAGLMLSARPIDALLGLTEILLHEPTGQRIRTLLSNEVLNNHWRQYTAVFEIDHHYAQELELKVAELNI